MTWATAREYAAGEGCRLLASKGLRAVEFNGDSFMRHMYEGIGLTLTRARLRCTSGHTRCKDHRCLEILLQGCCSLRAGVNGLAKE